VGIHTGMHVTISTSSSASPNGISCKEVWHASFNLAALHLRPCDCRVSIRKSMTREKLSMIEREDYADVATIEPDDIVNAEPISANLPYPSPLATEACRGVFGDLVARLEPHTETDPIAVLIQAMVAFGNIVGRHAYFVADGTRHYTNVFAVLVAASSKGRKGTAWSHVRNCFTAIDPVWRIVSGLSSGEGLIWHVRDAHYVEREVQRQGRATGEREVVLDDAGITDKRLLVAEPEFARVLRVGEREGATLSPVLREAWDSGNLASLTKNCPAKATDAHISVVGHITAEELRRCLTATEVGNGFGNRFLWVCANRSKYLPDGGDPDMAALDALTSDFQLAIDQARQRGDLRRDAAASARWRSVYHDLSEGRPGLLGSMTGRAEAQVMRLACIYALADAARSIEVEHLDAALALWRYCFDSARFIFGDSLGNPVADDLVLALRAAGAVGLTRSEMSRDVFGRNRSAREILVCCVMASS
jgi:hypothetical protein